MRFYTPAWGPLKGVLCRRHPDGTLEPCPEIDSSKVSPSILLPPEDAPTPSGSGIETAGELSGFNTRENIAAMAAKMKEHGFSNADARARQTALRWEREERARRG